MGIDLAKRSFHLYAADRAGRSVLSRKLTRARLSAVVAQLPACTIAMEACGSAHHWARLFRTFGHEVRLIAPQFVKPYVKSNKNDAADAEAICEAAQRPNMRFVAVKSVEQQDIQAIHRMRSLAVERCLFVLLGAGAEIALTGGGPFYATALAAQVLFYLLALLGWVTARRGGPSRVTALPYTFVLLNLAAASAFLAFVRGTEGPAWKALR